MSAPLKTAFNAFHKKMNGKMVTYAGYEMPIQYSSGVLKEHHHTRTAAGLFDVSHMGQVRFTGNDREKFLEWVTPADIKSLGKNAARLSIITNPEGGIKDDCIISRYEDHCYVVINAGCKAKDIAHFEDKLKEFKGDCKMEILSNKALLALQGPKAAEVLGKYVNDLEKHDFMTGRLIQFEGQEIRVTRCGYTGEDGFEVAIDSDKAIDFAELLMKNPLVQPIGLAARDSLRLEAGMCLYGHELDEHINPVAAKLMWLINKKRMADGGFIGHEAIANFKENATKLCPMSRTGLISEGPVARDGTEIVKDGKTVGKVTSGCPSPTLKKNVAQCYIDSGIKVGENVQLKLRGKLYDAIVSKMPFVPTHYYRAK